jgi:hypothetical protein
MSDRVTPSTWWYPMLGPIWHVSMDEYVDRVLARIGKSPITWRAKDSSSMGRAPSLGQSDISSALGIRWSECKKLN